MKKIKIILLLTAWLYTISATEATAQVSFGISISTYAPPPPLPVYFQPPCPTDGYLWAPGYWAYTDDGYFWVPGVWVLPPQMGYYWTPGYWGYESGMYGFHTGYWGPRVGFYGGINYGYGYGGYGYGGGRWEGNSFVYNIAVVNVNRNVIHHTYSDRTVIVNNGMVASKRISYNGGRGGITAGPGPQQQSSTNERHIQATAQQVSHMQSASRDRNQFASVNRGRPATTAMNTPGGHRYSQRGITASAPAIPVLPPPNNVRPQSAPQVQNHNAPNDHSSASHHTANQPAPVQQQMQNTPAPRVHSQQRNNPSQEVQPQQQQHQQRSNPSQEVQPQQQQHQRNNPSQEVQPQQQQHQQHNNPSQEVQPQQQHHNNPSPGAQHQQQHDNPPQQHNAPQQPGGSEHQKDH